MELLGSEQMAWGCDLLLRKAQRYSEKMHGHSVDEWDFVFWSTLTLELVARSALAHISPVLLAEGNNYANTVYALGYSPSHSKFVPKSVSISEVFKRLQECVPEFDQEVQNFCVLHMERRNEEFHTGSNALDGLKDSAWLPTFYRACSVLLNSMGEKLEILMDLSRATHARILISAASEESAKDVQKTIRAYKTVWDEKAAEEKEKLSNQAAILATRFDGHRIECPACRSVGLVTGSPIAPPKKSIEEDAIVERQQFVPTKFECSACQLKISGLARLGVAGLGDIFVQTTHYEPTEYYELEDKYESMRDDNNEPF